MELFLKYFILFFVYSVLGWIVETIEILLVDKKLTNRGFYIGPYCPIYGVGSILLTILLSKYNHDPFVLFILSVFICAAFEYFSSWILEKIFKLRWWDYSDNKYNINGRVSLGNMILFGLGGVLIICLLNPFFLNILNNLSHNLLTIISAILASIFLIDTIISVTLIINFKKITKKFHKDSTEDIKKYIRKYIENEKKLYNRLINSFPKLRKVVKNSKK